MKQSLLEGDWFFSLSQQDQIYQSHYYHQIVPVHAFDQEDVIFTYLVMFIMLLSYSSVSSKRNYTLFARGCWV